ncbi:6895_t:CDS:2 [Funneliformis caledonium]|uniref:6895_t:CDS:1 n=1 Tax=Funneliformis caledonium TaxID=1117310 RepID=A0A9N8W430_9GLOM|nr:6895_t:CDS:2 [Funneliformis caledonium]
MEEILLMNRIHTKVQKEIPVLQAKRKFVATSRFTVILPEFIPHSAKFMDQD